MSDLNRREFMKTSAAAATGIVLGCTVRNRFDLIIENGLVYDGTGQPGQMADVGIRDGKVLAIGDLSAATADQKINAAGKVVAPGFIDIHTHTDIELLVNPTGDSKLRQGVTTEVAGNCGFSPFPLNQDAAGVKADELKEKYDLECRWEDAGGFLNEISKKNPALNYATFTGHGNLRAYVIGRNDVTPTPAQLEKMQQVLAESMQQGSLGLSTGLEYAPGSYATTEELIALCRVVAAHGGVYATHMRNEDDTLEEAVEEAIRICRESGVFTQLSHLKACNHGNWHKIPHVLEMIQQARDEGLLIHADRYPYIAYGTSLATCLPLWARQGSTDEVVARLQDDVLWEKMKSYMAGRGKRIGGWDRFVINRCEKETLRIWEGKSVLVGATETGQTPLNFIRSLLIDDRLNPGIVGFAMDEDNLKTVLAAPFVMIGSDGTAVAPEGPLGIGKRHPRYYGTFPRVLGKYCRQENVFGLAEAIHKMTQMPAEKLGLIGRGQIKEGFWADMVVFDPETIIDQATFVEPHQFPIGISQVIVNGQLAVNGNGPILTRSGVVLSHI